MSGIARLVKADVKRYAGKVTGMVAVLRDRGPDEDDGAYSGDRQLDSDRLDAFVDGCRAEGDHGSAVQRLVPRQLRNRGEADRAAKAPDVDHHSTSARTNRLATTKASPMAREAADSPGGDPNRAVRARRRGCEAGRPNAGNRIAVPKRAFRTRAGGGCRRRSGGASSSP